MGVVATTTIRVRLDGTLVDISADTRAFQPIRLQYGISGTGPVDRVAEAGMLTWALNNSASNSTGNAGAYSPGHADARSGWDIGCEVVLEIAYDGTTFTKFVGTLVSITPDTGKRRQAVLCTAVDWMDEAARVRVRAVTIATDKRADQLIDTLVTSSVTTQPRAKSFATGQSTFAIAFDNLLDAQTPVLRGLADAVLSELGYLYIRGTATSYDAGGGGVLTFESRHSRPLSGAALGSFDNTMRELTVQRSRDQMISRVYIVVHPRTTAGSNAVIYELTSTGSTPEVPANSTILISCPYADTTGNFRIAATTLVTPVSGTDWIANSNKDGSGTNLTSSVTVSVNQQAANSVELSIVNAHASTAAFLTTLQVRGISVKDISQTVVSAIDGAAATAYGETDARLSLTYEDRAGEYATTLAEWVLNTYANPRFTVDSFSIQNNKSAYLMTQGLAREPGDKITFAESMSGITETSAGAEVGYFIQSVSMAIAIPGTITTTWTLAPSSSQPAWILDQVGASELGITTILGFA